MFTAVALLSVIAAVNADLPEILKGKVQEIIGAASMACSNKYINNTEDAFTIDDVLCDTKLVPEQFQKYIPGLEFGANSTVCGGYACALRFLGCVDATYRVEAKIVTATGKAESCSERVGLNVTMCQKIGKFITSAPLQGRKRDVEAVLGEMEPFTQAEFDAEVAVVKAAPKEEVTEADMHFVKLLVRSYFPAEAASVNNFGLAADDTLENFVARKRDTIDDILKHAQLCNPIISAGVNLLVAQVPQVSIIKDKFGPCGLFCEMAMCGLTLMCHTVSRSALLSLEAQRMGEGCNKTSCSKWAPPLNVCMNAPACNNAMGQYAPNTLDLTVCAPPKQILSAGQQDVNDCCDRCDDKCSTVPCTQRRVEDCGVPVWPLCKPFVVAREDPFRCCATCIDVCRTANAMYAGNQAANCPPPPTSCPEGKMLGPANPTTCCLTCVDPCEGVSCPNAPTQAQCEQQGKVYQFKDRKSLAANKDAQCADCCPTCVDKGGDQKTEKPTGAAASSVLAASVAFVAAVVAFFF
jgi:hypothetical protein